MRPIAPRTGEQEITLAEEQHEYQPITVAIRERPSDQPGVTLVSLVTRWTLTPGGAGPRLQGRGHLRRAVDLRSAIAAACRLSWPDRLMFGAKRDAH